MAVRPQVVICRWTRRSGPSIDPHPTIPDQMRWTWLVVDACAATQHDVDYHPGLFWLTPEVNCWITLVVELPCTGKTTHHESHDR